MGQRSQIYVKYTDKTDGKTHLIARYYSWVFGERMVSRARHSIEWLRNNRDYPWNISKCASRILDTNFDFKDVVPSDDILEYGMSREEMFHDIENNDGKLFIEVTEKGKLKYCFTDKWAKELYDGDGYMTFDTEDCYEQYKWKNAKESKKQCVRNINWLNKNAQLMTLDELNRFMNADFEELK